MQKLAVYSLDPIKSLASFATISIGRNNSLKIDRPSTRALRAAAESNSILVTGEPGSGKSGALYDLAVALQNDNHDVLFISADRVESSSLNSLKQELALDHSLVEVLENWYGNGPAYLITDVLDAARSEYGGRMRVLIDAVNTGTNKEIQELLRIPFNLRLLGELIGEGLAAAQLTPIRTQLELLDRYWQERVIRADHHADLREAVLRRAVAKMVRNRVLRVARTDITEGSASGPILADLLSADLLQEHEVPMSRPDRYTLTFAHHLLFDYAVARLLFRTDPARLVEEIAADPELVVAFRPSLALHFRYEWEMGGVNRSQNTYLNRCCWRLEVKPSLKKCLKQAIRLIELPPENNCIDAIAHQIFFAAGAFDLQQNRTDKAPNREQRRRFLKEAESILDKLASTGLSNVAYHLAEL